MKITRGTLVLVTALAGLALGGSSLAQQGDAANGNEQQTGTNAVNAEPSATTNEALATESSGEQSSAKGVERDEMVVIGHDVLLKAGDTARCVVVMGGSAKIEGKVRDLVVALGGDVEVDGQVGNQVVAVLGNITLGPGAKIRHDAVAVGGKVELSKGASVGGQVREVDWSKFGLPAPAWLRSWFIHCALMLRPLAPQVGWVWVLAGIFFLFYLLIAALFPRPVAACVSELTMRPATTFLIGLLAKILLPLAIVILIATGLGIFVVPFVMAALILGAILGKVALLEWLGFKLGHQFGAQALQPLLALLIGTGIVYLLYMVPVLGLLSLAIISIWGLGGAVTAAFIGLRRESPQKPAAPSPRPPAEVALAVAVPGSSNAASEAAEGQPNPGAPEPPPSRPAEPILPPVIPESLAYPRAGFWERMGAAFLDVVLVSIASALIHPFWPLVALAYFSAMWTWKGTTIGGIVLGLKVVRADGQPVTFPVALVRALAGAFSVFVLFLGFLWIAWDPEKQGWHDKIAGTVVLKLPRGTPLVCL